MDRLLEKDCPVCNADCSAANPPVANCPLLTEGQFLVLKRCAEPKGFSKGRCLPGEGKYWRNFDQLERRGMIERIGFDGTYRATTLGQFAIDCNSR